MHRWFLLALATIGGCSPFTINADYDPSTDFSKYKTWDWFTSPQPYGAGMDPLIEKRIRASLEEELPHRGLVRPSLSNSADLLVSYHLSVAQRLEVTPSTATYGYGWGRGYAAYGSSDVRTYDEGTLLVDLIDARSKSLVWRGTARATVYGSSTPEERTERVRAAVQAILDQYPPAK